MKKKYLSLFGASLLALTSCGARGVHHEISDYILELPYTDNFRILQLTDTHIGDKDDQELHYKFMDLTIEEAHPNLIVVTGDVFTFASKGTALRFFNWMDSHNIPWTLTWGNHDEQVYFSIDWVTDVLTKYGHNCKFIDLQDDDVDGNANFAINLMNGTNLVHQVIMMDSNRYHYGLDYNGYDYFHQNQIDWYSRLVDTTKTQYGNYKSTMYYHIPLPEVDNAFGEGNVIYGEKNENTCPPKYNSGFFKVIHDAGSTKGMFFGHDHVNNFRAEYEGVLFAYGVKATNRIYYEDVMLGGQVIVIDNTGNFSVENPIYHKYSEVL